MTNYDCFIEAYRGNTLLLDTNLLVVLLVGDTNESFISKIKPTRSYTVEDYRLLKKILKHFNIITTPHVLAETSNLLEKVDRFYKEKIFDVFGHSVVNLLEVQVLAKDVVDSPIFFKLGLTDSAIGKLSKQNVFVLTDDFDLHSYLLGIGATAANMNFFRSAHLIK